MLSVLEILIKIVVFKNWKKQKLHPRLNVNALTLFAIIFLSCLFIMEMFEVFSERDLRPQYLKMNNFSP